MNRAPTFELVPILGARLWRVAITDDNILRVFLTLGDALNFVRKRAGNHRAKIVVRSNAGALNLMKAESGKFL